MPQISDQFERPPNRFAAFFSPQKKALIYEKEKESFKDHNISDCCK